MKFIKACLLLLLLSASSHVVAVTDLGSFSERLNDPSSFNLGSLNNDSYSWLGSVTKNGNFTHPYSFTLNSDKGGGPLDYPSNINFGLGHLKLSSHVNGSALDFFDNDNISKGETSVTSISLSSPVSSNLTGTISDNYGMSMILSFEPEQWVMMVVVLFLVGMQVINAKRAAEPLALK